MKKLVTTPITGKIWWATVNDEKGIITGDKKDVTDNAIQAVLDHLLLQEKFIKNGFHGYTYSKIKGGECTICAFDNDKHVCVSKEIYEELKEYKSMYEDLCKQGFL